MAERPIVCPGHRRPVVGLDFSPETADGYFFVSACLDKLPMLRDASSGDWIGTFEGHKGAVWSAKLNRDATRAATGSADFSARVWDATSGDSLLSLDHRHIVRAVDISNSGAQLVTGGNECLLRIFDISGASTEPVVQCKTETRIMNVTWLPDDRHIVAGTDGGELLMLDATTGEIVKSVGMLGTIKDLELSNDQNTLTVCTAKQVSFLDPATMQVTAAHSVDVELNSVSLAPNKSKFVAGSEDMWVYEFDYASGEQVGCRKGHHGPVHCVRYHPDGGTYASAYVLQPPGCTCEGRWQFK